MMSLVKVFLFGTLLQLALGSTGPIIETLVKGLTKGYFKSIQGECGILNYNLNNDPKLNSIIYNLQLGNGEDSQLADILDRREKCVIGVADAGKNVSFNRLTSLIERTFLYTAILINATKEMRKSFQGQKYPYLAVIELVCGYYCTCSTVNKPTSDQPYLGQAITLSYFFVIQ